MPHYAGQRYICLPHLVTISRDHIKWLTKTSRIVELYLHINKTIRQHISQSTSPLLNDAWLSLQVTTQPWLRDCKILFASRQGTQWCSLHTCLKQDSDGQGLHIALPEASLVDGTVVQAESCIRPSGQSLHWGPARRHSLLLPPLSVPRKMFLWPLPYPFPSQ